MNNVSASDFAYILSDEKRTVSYKVVTKTTDPMTGSEISSYAAAANVDVVFFLQDNKFKWDPEGLVAVGDAYIMALPSVGIKKQDQFTVDGETYNVDSVKERRVMGVHMHDFGTAFRVA